RRELPGRESISGDVTAHQRLPLEQPDELHHALDLLDDRIQAVPAELESAGARVLLPPVFEQAGPVSRDETPSPVDDQIPEVRRGLGDRLLGRSQRFCNRRLPARFRVQQEVPLHCPTRPGRPPGGARTLSSYWLRGRGVGAS